MVSGLSSPDRLSDDRLETLVVASKCLVSFSKICSALFLEVASCLGLWRGSRRLGSKGRVVALMGSKESGESLVMAMASSFAGQVQHRGGFIFEATVQSQR